MSASREAVASEVLSTRMGVMMHLAPRSSLNELRILEDLRTEAGASLERGDIQLVVDLASVQIINSAALETLADLQDQCGRLGGWLKLSNVTALVQDILRISGMSAYVPVMDINLDIFQPPAAQPHKLGDILIAKQLLTRERMEEAIQIQKRTSRRLGQILIDKHWVAEHEVLRALGEQLSVPFVRLRAGIYDPDIVTLVKKNTARRLQVLPLQRLRGELALATMDPQATSPFEVSPGAEPHYYRSTNADIVPLDP